MTLIFDPFERLRIVRILCVEPQWNGLDLVVWGAMLRSKSLKSASHHLNLVSKAVKSIKIRVMENRVGSAGGSVEFEYKVESSEAGKWYQGKIQTFYFQVPISAQIFFPFFASDFL